MFKTRDIDLNESRLAGRSKGVVIDNRDPLLRGRIRVLHPQVGSTAWIEYLNPTGIFSAPSIGDLVYVECESGLHEVPKAHGSMIKGPDASPELPSKFQRGVPTNRGYYTPGGHSIELDDGIKDVGTSPSDTPTTTNSRGIRITTIAGNTIQLMEDAVNGLQYILLEDVGGNMVKLDYKNNVLTINSIGTTTFSTAENRTDNIGGQLTINVVGNATLHSNANVNISAAQKVTIEGPSNVEVNGNSANVVTTESYDPFTMAPHPEGFSTFKAGGGS